MNPLVKILFFIFVLLIMNLLSGQLLWMLCFAVFVFAAGQQFKTFIRKVNRMRWLFLSILIIYALDTPGEYVQIFSSSLAFTYEGIQLGLIQIAKLLIALASLSLLFSTSSIEYLMTGLYMLLIPLKFIGINVERFSARLLLTLDYVEELVGKDNYKISFKHLNDIHLANVNMQADKIIVIHHRAFNIVDKVMVAIFIAITIGWGLMKALQ